MKYQRVRWTEETYEGEADAENPTLATVCLLFDEKHLVLHHSDQHMRCDLP